MLGLANELVWRVELSCGTVCLLQSTPDLAPSGIYLCPEHDGAMASIELAVRWDRHLAERARQRMKQVIEDAD